MSDVIHLTPTKRGDSWIGIPALYPELAPPPEPIVSAKIAFKHGSIFGPVGLELSTEDETIQIIDAARWELSVPRMSPAQFTLGVGDWFCDVQITDASGFVQSSSPGLLPVTPDITP